MSYVRSKFASIPNKCAIKNQKKKKNLKKNHFNLNDIVQKRTRQQSKMQKQLMNGQTKWNKISIICRIFAMIVYNSKWLKKKFIISFV